MSNDFDINCDLKDLVNDFSDLVNNIAFDYNDAGKVLAEHFSHQHRTLQQIMLAVLASFLKEISKTEFTDLRNEASINWTKEVAKIPANFPFV